MKWLFGILALFNCVMGSLVFFNVIEPDLKSVAVKAYWAMAGFYLLYIIKKDNQND
jgi:hypothetical protein